MNNKKIAILTLYHNNHNYGGLLQAYALQKTLAQLGCESKQICYNLMSGYPGWNPIKAVLKKPFADMYHLLKYGRWYEGYIKRNKMIEKFEKKIPHTKVVTAKTIATLNDQYDCFISGSDQIWNPIGWQSTLFFDFLPDNKERFSYAASIARDKLSEYEYEFMYQYLSKYSVISVREKQTADMINEKYPDLDVKCVPDPVFLLKQNDWISLIEQKKESNIKPYIFAYFLGDDNENRIKAMEYAKDRKMKIIFASYLDFSHAHWDTLHRNVISPPMGVEEFLYNIANASLVLTDSFHAAAFSCILKTPFYALPRFKANDINSMNLRILNLVQELDITGRYTVHLPKEYRWQECELENINTKLKQMRKDGLQYIRRSLKDIIGENTYG